MMNRSPKYEIEARGGLATAKDAHQLRAIITALRVHHGIRDDEITIHEVRRTQLYPPMEKATNGIVKS